MAASVRAVQSRLQRFRIHQRGIGLNPDRRREAQLASLGCLAVLTLCCGEGKEGKRYEKSIAFDRCRKIDKSTVRRAECRDDYDWDEHLCHKFGADCGAAEPCRAGAHL